MIIPCEQIEYLISTPHKIQDVSLQMAGAADISIDQLFSRQEKLYCLDVSVLKLVLVEVVVVVAAAVVVAAVVVGVAVSVTVVVVEVVVVIIIVVAVSPKTGSPVSDMRTRT